EDPLPDASELQAEPLGETVEHSDVDADAYLLHPVEHRGERQIDFAVDALDSGLLRLREQRWNQRMNCCSGCSLRGGRGLAVACGYVGERLRGVGRIERIGKQHRVVGCASQYNSLRVKQVHGQLQVVRTLWRCILFKQLA